MHRRNATRLLRCALAGAFCTAVAAVAAVAPDDARAAPTLVVDEAEWTLVFGGDSLLTRRIRDDADPFARIRPTLDSADLAIVNVETAISTRGTAAPKTFTFRSPPSFATRLAAAGVDIASLANNHALDFGRDALLDTVGYLSAAGVEPVGADATIERALAPVVKDIRGVRVAVLAGTQIIPNAGWAATATRPGVVTAGRHHIDNDSVRLIHAVRAARAANDVVVVIMHWGWEGDACPSKAQKRLGALLRQAGAVAVLGAHPHVLQPIVSDSSPGTANPQGLIAYSLGNFIWDPRSGSSGETGLLELTFTGTRLSTYRFHPHRLDGNGWASAVDPSSALGTRITARTTRRC